MNFFNSSNFIEEIRNLVNSINNRDEKIFDFIDSINPELKAKEFGSGLKLNSVINLINLESFASPLKG